MLKTILIYVGLRISKMLHNYAINCVGGQILWIHLVGFSTYPEIIKQAKKSSKSSIIIYLLKTMLHLMLSKLMVQPKPDQLDRFLHTCIIFL